MFFISQNNTNRLALDGVQYRERQTELEKGGDKRECV